MIHSRERKKHYEIPIVRYVVLKITTSPNFDKEVLIDNLPAKYY